MDEREPAVGSTGSGEIDGLVRARAPPDVNKLIDPSHSHPALLRTQTPSGRRWPATFFFPTCMAHTHASNPDRKSKHPAIIISATTTPEEFRRRETNGCDVCSSAAFLNSDGRRWRGRILPSSRPHTAGQLSSGYVRAATSELAGTDGVSERKGE